MKHTVYSRYLISGPEGDTIYWAKENSSCCTRCKRAPPEQKRKIPPLQKKEKIRSKQGWKGLKKERKMQRKRRFKG
jgi:hypothetical protein